MENLSSTFIDKVKRFVADFISENFSEKICYHNIDHTLEVVEAVELIGTKCNLSENELKIVITSAWFHDTGYYLGCEDHEKSSAKIARSYLLEQKVDINFVDQVCNCIMATKIPQSPQNLAEKIICDADLFHLSTEKFFEKSELLYQEISFFDKNMTPEIWQDMSREFVAAHKYHTSYGKNVLFPQLQKNLQQLTS